MISHPNLNPSSRPEPSPGFGLIIIGDEILSGERVDKHMPRVIELLGQRGLQLAGVPAGFVGEERDERCREEHDDDANAECEQSGEPGPPRGRHVLGSPKPAPRRSRRPAGERTLFTNACAPARSPPSRWTMQSS